MRLTLILSACLLVAGCQSGGPDLAQQAKTATLTYTAVALNEQTVLKADVLSPKVEGCVKAADTVVFNYQDELNRKAQEWLDAGAADRKPIEDAFLNIQTLFNASTMSLTDLMTGKGVC